MIRLLDYLPIERMTIMYEFNGRQYVSATTYIKLEQENKKLKEDLAFKNTMLDNVKAEYENLQDINKKLKAELEFYKKQYKHSMGED